MSAAVRHSSVLSSSIQVGAGKHDRIGDTLLGRWLQLVQVNKKQANKQIQYSSSLSLSLPLSLSSFYFVAFAPNHPPTLYTNVCHRVQGLLTAKASKRLQAERGEQTVNLALRFRAV